MTQQVIEPASQWQNPNIIKDESEVEIFLPQQ